MKLQEGGGDQVFRNITSNTVNRQPVKGILKVTKSPEQHEEIEFVSLNNNMFT